MLAAICTDFDKLALKKKKKSRLAVLPDFLPLRWSSKILEAFLTETRHFLLITNAHFCVEIRINVKS